MLKTIIWFIKFWLYQFRALLFWPEIKKIRQTKGAEAAKQYIHQIAGTWARKMVENTGSTIVIKGLELIPDERNVLFVSNHQANFDIPILLGYLPKEKGFVAKIELQKLPLVHNWMRALNCVFLDRKSPRKSLETIHETIKLLKEGHSMIIFPEGTRSKSAKLNDFKKGSLKVAQKAQVPIVPVTINGSYKIMGANGLLIKPARVEVIVGQPIYPESLTAEEKDNLAHYVQQKIAANLQQ